MTPQQIAEKVYPKSATNAREKLEAIHIIMSEGEMYAQRIELTTLITTLQKETWDAACEAFRFKAIEAITMINPRFEHEIGAVTDLESPPFNPEK